jgi:hypothetical protein
MASHQRHVLKQFVFPTRRTTEEIRDQRPSMMNDKDNNMAETRGNRTVDYTPSHVSLSLSRLFDLGLAGAWRFNGPLLPVEELEWNGWSFKVKAGINREAKKGSPRGSESGGGDKWMERAGPCNYTVGTVLLQA